LVAFVFQFQSSRCTFYCFFPLTFLGFVSSLSHAFKPSGPSYFPPSPLPTPKFVFFYEEPSLSFFSRTEQWLAHQWPTHSLTDPVSAPRKKLLEWTPSLVAVSNLFGFFDLNQSPLFQFFFLLNPSFFFWFFLKNTLPPLRFSTECFSFFFWTNPIPPTWTFATVHATHGFFQSRVLVLPRGFSSLWRIFPLPAFGVGKLVPFSLMPLRLDKTGCVCFWTDPLFRSPLDAFRLFFRFVQIPPL